MKLLIVSASQRSPSQSAKVGGYLAEQAQAFSQVVHLELCLYRLPFWDGDDAHRGPDWPALDAHIADAEALVLITPEWGGMASPLLKNFLLMCNRQHTAHKPALIVSVCSGINGAYPVAEIKMNALKNNKLIPLPDHLIIRDAENVLNDQNGGSRDSQLRGRIDYSLHMLAQYAQALKPLRQAHIHTPYPMQQEYAYGM
jgi:azobenzene reductase